MPCSRRGSAASRCRRSSSRPTRRRRRRQTAAATGIDLRDILAGDAAGKDAAADEIFNRRSFGRQSEADRQSLGRIKRNLATLPTIASRTHLPSPRGRRIDVARTAREARRTAGETLRLFRKVRPEKPRRILLLVDVSGSMKAHSEATLRFAQLLTRTRPKVETFCFGTRLSRVTATLKHRLPDEALARLLGAGVRFRRRHADRRLAGRPSCRSRAMPRWCAAPSTLVFSDGLERGEPDAMIHAVNRLARLSHRLVWVTPLAADPRYRPLTRAMAGILPVLDGLADGSDLPALERLLRKLPSIENAPRGEARRRLPDAPAQGRH